MTLTDPPTVLLPGTGDRESSARTTQPGVTGPLSVVQDAPERALALLEEADAPSLDAVVWLSVHLSAVEHVLHPVISRVLDDRAVSALRGGTVSVQELLRLLELVLTGDRAGIDQMGSTAALASAVRAQARRERRALQRLAEHLSPDEQRQVAAAYSQALQHAPTRPHPHTPHGARLGALAYHVNAWRDRVMDTLDSRRLPTPRRQRMPLRSGRSIRGLLGSSTAR